MCVCTSVCVCVSHIFFIHLPDDRHLGCFHTLTVVNTAAMNIGVKVSFQLVFFGYIPKSGISGSYPEWGRSPGGGHGNRLKF